MGNSSLLEAGLLEVSLTRRIAAAPEFVFRAWIDAKHLAEWWGPKGFTNPVCEADPRVGTTAGLWDPLGAQPQAGHPRAAAACRRNSRTRSGSAEAGSRRGTRLCTGRKSGVR